MRLASRSHPAVTLIRATTTARRRRIKSASGPAVPEYDPFAPAAIANPDAAYAQLHARGGVFRCSERDLWILTAHADVHAAARDHSALSSAQGVSHMPAALPMMITTDRPDHDRLRRMVAPHFTGAAAMSRVPMMERIADEAIDRLLERPGSDAVAELAIPLPVKVIAKLLGVPAADFATFRRYSDGIVKGFHAPKILASLPFAVQVVRSILGLHAYLQDTFARLRDKPGDDVLSALLATQEQGALDDEELFWFALMLLVAGNETTSNLLGALLHALAQDPDAYQRLRRDPELIGPATEEALRWGSPIQGLFRVAVADYEAGGTVIPAGSRVLLAFGAANRDPLVFSDPDRYILDREPASHVAFGAGIHFCLGAHLARQEAAAVLRRLIARVERIEPAGPAQWTRNPVLRGLHHLPVRLVAVGATTTEGTT